MTRFQRVVTRIGMGDQCGDLSFNKVVTLGAGLTFVFAVVFGLVVLRQFPTNSLITFGTFVVCAGFGLKGIAMFMARWTATNTTNENVNVNVDAAAVIEAVRKRRDPKLGQEDSGRVPQVHDD